MDWRSFLSRWSQERIDEHDVRQHKPLDPEAVRGRWLGFPAATDIEIEQAEARIGRALPPSYRAFLQTTNGWASEEFPVFRLRSVEEIGWLRELEPLWTEPWTDEDDEDLDEYAKETATLFDRSLLVSGEADLTIVLLDPDDVDENGDWAVYRYSSWSHDEPKRHANLLDYLASGHDWWLEHTRERRALMDAQEAATDRGRDAALAGDLETALAELNVAVRSPELRPGILLGQLQLFLSEYEEGKRRVSRPFFLAHWREEHATDPLIIREFLPLLLREEHEATPNDRMPSLQAALRADHPGLQRLVDRHRAQNAAIPADFGNPEFDTLIKTALTAHPEPSEALWQAVLHAMPHWRPRSHDHLAPVVLLAHPALAALITPERGRELLSVPRLTDPPETPRDRPRHRPMP
ncbi:SMI1/KNR4 family protein [Actinocorallia populi]|uniref:SMI1/KNR4 family protein n=1 Tax=Actinocorallia populi TaxID=2079200 RepID=UPI0013006CE8|nr:SMI1/KNR4 family protein [Actinocorallia populi]